MTATVPNAALDLAPVLDRFPSSEIIMTGRPRRLRDLVTEAVKAGRQIRDVRIVAIDENGGLWVQQATFPATTAKEISR